MHVEPFSIVVEDALLHDLRGRLERTRRPPDAPLTYLHGGKRRSSHAQL